jgi:hypothetical protein
LLYLGNLITYQRNTIALRLRTLISQIYMSGMVMSLPFSMVHPTLERQLIVSTGASL